MHRRFAYRQIDVGALRPGGWRAWAALAVAATAAVALLLTFGLIFIILLPVFLVLGLIGRWWLGRELRKAAQAGRSRPEIIEGSYEIVEPPAQPGRGWGKPRRD
jgi:membrane protein implicated in regulation of membrane protease activity